MQTPIRKQRKAPRRHGRLLLLLLLLLALLLSLGGWYLLTHETVEPAPEAEPTYGELISKDPAEVARLAVTLRSGESWTLVQDAAGAVTVLGENSFVVSDSAAKSLLNAACVVSYEDVLLDDQAEIADQLADFGLSEPRAVAEVTYDDGTAVTLTIGDASPMEDENWYFLLVSGDARLFALDKDTAEAFMVTQAELHPVTQPTLHKARFDQITFAGADGAAVASWALEADVLDSDAASAWMLTSPWRYPADATAMSNLRTNLSNLRLGAYVGEATPEEKERCGLTDPTFTITLHMAAGTTGTTDAAGVYRTTDWPESTFTLAVGSAKNDSVDYVLYDGSIYVTSHYSLAVFTEMAPLDTVSRYPLPVTLDALSTLTIEQAGQDTTAYVLTREPQVAENNDLVTDSEGNVVYDNTCTRNGVDLAYSVFEGAWEQLYAVKVTGILPEGFTVTEPVHTTYTFVTITGREHVLQLARYDALHDAVILDGTALFYLISGGLEFDTGA